MSSMFEKEFWRSTSLDEIARVSKERVGPDSGEIERYVAGEHLDPEDLRIHRWGRVGEGYLGPAFHRRFRSGQVLYGSRRVYLRKVAVAHFDGVTANTTFVVETCDERLLYPGFLPFVLTAEPFYVFAQKASKGSVNPYVNWSDLAAYRFLLPPLEEQKRIASMLWSIESHCERLKILEDSIITARDAWITSRLGRQPSRPLGQVIALQNGRPVPSELYGKGDFPLLRPSDMMPDFTTRWSDASVSVPKKFAEENSEWMLEPGDTVINMTAQSLDDRFLGRVCTTHDRALLNQRIGRLTSDTLTPEFVAVALSGPEFSDWVARRSEGSKVKHMHWRHIEDFPVAFPARREQHDIVEEASSWSGAIRSCIEERFSLRELSSSVKADVFAFAQ